MTMARTAKEKQAGRAETMEVLLGRSAEIPSKMVNDWERIVLDFHSSDESTIHPGNELLVQALQHYFGNTYLVQPVHHMVGFWGSKIEQDAELIRPGEKGRKYIFLLNNTCAVRQMVRRPGASFPNVEPLLTSLIKRYKKCYLDECWAPLKCLSSDEFTAEFLATCNRQMTWKVAAELRYKLRQEIAGLIAPPYDDGSRVIQGLFEG